MKPPTTPGYYYVVNELTGSIQIMELIDSDDGHPLRWMQIGDEMERDDVASGDRWRFAPVPPYDSPE